MWGQHGRVIYVQHDEPGSELEPGSAGWQLHADLAPSPHDSRVRKTACDSFLDTELGFLLAEQSVTDCSSAAVPPTLRRYHVAQRRRQGL